MNVHGTSTAEQRAVGRWRNAVMVAFGLGGVAVATWGPRLSELRADLDLGDAAVGLVLSGITVGSITGLLTSSMLLSRLGARRAILATLWLVAIGIATVGAGAGLAHSVPAVVAGFIAIGLGIGAVDVMINVEGAAVEQAAGRTLMPLMHAGWSAGAILGAGIGAACAALHIPPQWQFMAEAVLIAGAAAAATRSIPLTRRPGDDVQRPPLTARFRGWRQGWSDRRLLLIGVVMLGVELGEGTANSWLSLAVRDGHHQPEAVAALFLMTFAIGETVARVAGGPLVDRLGRVRTVRLTTALGVVGVLLFILASSAPLILLGTLLWAVGVSMGFPLGMSAAADSGPDPAARVSVVASIGYLANLAGPSVIGLLSQAFGLLNAFWAVIALLGIGFVLSAALKPRSATAAPTPRAPLRATP